ncbi:hypothetical protein SNEBB_007498 [Seison nebaliae]|nr:hypothetical protein SNEBB_007498 [Seison nebaliae]
MEKRELMMNPKKLLLGSILTSLLRVVNRQYANPNFVTIFRRQLRESIRELEDNGGNDDNDDSWKYNLYRLNEQLNRQEAISIGDGDRTESSSHINDNKMNKKKYEEKKMIRTSSSSTIECGRSIEILEIVEFQLNEWNNSNRNSIFNEISNKKEIVNESNDEVCLSELEERKLKSFEMGDGIERPISTESKIDEEKEKKGAQIQIGEMNISNNLDDYCHLIHMETVTNSAHTIFKSKKETMKRKGRRMRKNMESTQNSLIHRQIKKFVISLIRQNELEEFERLRQELPYEYNMGMYEPHPHLLQHLHPPHLYFPHEHYCYFQPPSPPIPPPQQQQQRQQFHNLHFHQTQQNFLQQQQQILHHINFQQQQQQQQQFHQNLLMQQQNLFHFQQQQQAQFEYETNFNQQKNEENRQLSKNGRGKERNRIRKSQIFPPQLFVPQTQFEPTIIPFPFPSLQQTFQSDQIDVNLVQLDENVEQFHDEKVNETIITSPHKSIEERHILPEFSIPVIPKLDYQSDGDKEKNRSNNDLPMIITDHKPTYFRKNISLIASRMVIISSFNDEENHKIHRIRHPYVNIEFHVKSKTFQCFDRFMKELDRYVSLMMIKKMFDPFLIFIGKQTEEKINLLFLIIGLILVEKERTITSNHSHYLWEFHLLSQRQQHFQLSKLKIIYQIIEKMPRNDSLVIVTEPPNFRTFVGKCIVISRRTSYLRRSYPHLPLKYSPNELSIPLTTIKSIENDLTNLDSSIDLSFLDSDVEEKKKNEEKKLRESNSNSTLTSHKILKCPNSTLSPSSYTSNMDTFQYSYISHINNTSIEDTINEICHHIDEILSFFQSFQDK